MESNPLNGFKGTFSFFQQQRLARIWAAHHDLVCARCGELLALVTRRPLIGRVHGMLPAPEVHGGFDRWRGHLKALRCAYLTVHTRTPVPDLEACRTSPEDNASMVLDLTAGADALFDGFRRNCRKTIRSGAKKGVSVEECAGESDFNRFYDILRKLSDDGRRFEILPKSCIGEICDAGFGKILLARSARTVVGGYLLLLGGESVHAWSGGIDRYYTRLSPGNLLMFESIRWACGQGYAYFDMGQQSLTENPRIVDYKLGFNPSLVPAITYEVPVSRLKVGVLKWKKKVERLLGVHPKTGAP